MDNFRRARDECVGSGACGGENPLRGESDEKGGDRDNDKIRPFLAANESENEENKEGDGVGVDGATGEG